jgi:dTDP-4-dehydrorhamnose reductase
MRVVLTGASGMVGAYVLEGLVGSGHEVIAWSGTDAGSRHGVPLTPVDLADAGATDRALALADPEAIIHAAAVSTTDAVNRDPERARAVNVGATGRLAAWCARHDRRLIYTSTDLVFDGTRPWSREEDPAVPVPLYGRTKLAAEPAVLAVPRGLVARISLQFGPSRSGRESYFDRTLLALRQGRPQTFFEDEFRTPLDLPTTAAILVRLVASDVIGRLHVAGRERVSRHELARRIAVAWGLDPGLVRANRHSDVTLAEPRPADVSLDTSRLAACLPDPPRPTIDEALARMARGEPPIRHS